MADRAWFAVPAPKESGEPFGSHAQSAMTRGRKKSANVMQAHCAFGIFGLRNPVTVFFRDSLTLPPVVNVVKCLRTWYHLFWDFFKAGVNTMSVIFDSLAYVKKLKAAGMPESQAEVQAETIMEWMEDRLATKVELETVRADLKRDIKEIDGKTETRLKELDIKAETRFRELDGKIETVRADLKRDIKELDVKIETVIETSKLELRKDIESAKVDTIKWTAGMFVAQTAMIIGALFAVMKMNQPNPQPTGYHTPVVQEMRLPAPPTPAPPAPAQPPSSLSR